MCVCVCVCVRACAASSVQPRNEGGGSSCLLLSRGFASLLFVVLRGCCCCYCCCYYYCLPLLLGTAALRLLHWQVDIYGLGVSLIEILEGTTANHKLRKHSLMLKLLNGPALTLEEGRIRRR